MVTFNQSPDNEVMVLRKVNKLPKPPTKSKIRSSSSPSLYLQGASLPTL